MKIPNNPISGRSIKEDFRALLAFARASRIVGISGGKLRTTPNGTTIEIPQASGPPPSILPPFWVHVFRDVDADAWKYNVAPGFVTYQEIGAPSDPTSYYVPTLGGTPIDAGTRPSATLPGNTAFVYVRVSTSKKGAIASTPTIEAFTSEQASTHHYPDSPDNPGEAGDYFFLVAEIEELNGEPGLERRITGNRNVPNQLIELENVGGGVNVYKTFEDGADNKHQVRTIKERDSQPQVKVRYSVPGDEELSEEVIVEGNGIDGTGRQVTVVDGLVTAITAGDTGADLNLEIWQQDWIALTAPHGVNFINIPTAATTTHYWRDGLYIGTVDPADGLGTTQRVSLLVESS